MPTGIDMKQVKWKPVSLFITLTTRSCYPDKKSVINLFILKTIFRTKMGNIIVICILIAHCGTAQTVNRSIKKTHLAKVAHHFLIQFTTLND